MGEAPLYSLIRKEAISSRSTKRSGVPLKRGSGSPEVLFQGVEGFSSFLKRKGEGLEVLFLSLFPSRR
jgi:hypothetical protein